MKIKFDQKMWQSKRAFAWRLFKEFPNQNWNDNHRTTSANDAHNHAVRWNALQEAVGHGHSELQIPLLELKM